MSARCRVTAHGGDRFLRRNQCNVCAGRANGPIRFNFGSRECGGFRARRDPWVDAICAVAALRIGVRVSWSCILSERLGHRLSLGREPTYRAIAYLPQYP